jgi:beta-phosphoglucomutase
VTAVRALLVDLDGTLVDTADANYLAYADALAEVGVRVARAAFDEVAHGRSWRQFLPGLLASAPGADPAAVAARKAAGYPARLAATRLNHGLVALIANRAAGWRAALVTTASRANAEAVLGHHQIAQLFDAVVTGDDVARHKPAPDAYRLAARLLEVRPEDCVAFEDSDAGMAAATAAGMPCLRIALPPERGSVAPEQRGTASGHR